MDKLVKISKFTSNGHVRRKNKDLIEIYLFIDRDCSSNKRGIYSYLRTYLQEKVFVITIN